MAAKLTACRPCEIVTATANIESNHIHFKFKLLTRADFFPFASPESCTPATEGAYCSVVDLILTVYSGSSESSLAAEVQVHDEIFAQLMAGAFLNDEIIAVRLHQEDEVDAPAGLTTNTGGSTETSQESSESSTSRTIAIAVLVTLAVLAMALIVFALYRKKKAKRDSNDGAGCGGEDGSKCDSSTLSGDDITAQETEATVSSV